MCGALSGGVLVVGGLVGRESVREDDRQALELARRYRARCVTEFGHTCARLRSELYAPGGLGSCAALVERAAAILLQFLEDVEGGA